MRWDREKLPKPDSHVYGENGAEIMVYNMKMNSKKKKRKTEKKRGIRNITVKRKNSKLLIIQKTYPVFWRSFYHV